MCKNPKFFVRLSSNLFEYLDAVVFYLVRISLPIRERKTFLVLRIWFFGFAEAEPSTKRVPN